VDRVETFETHLEASLQSDIDRIRHKVSEMSALAEQALEHCLQALVENKRQLAYGVILRDQYIDEREKELDRLCLDFLVKQQPVAGPLRFVYSTIKINHELERVGDYAESIARQVLKLSQMAVETPKERFQEITQLCIPMLGQSIQAFVEQDAGLAGRTIEVEEAVDGLKSKLNKDLVVLFRENKMPFEALNALMMIARHFERVSDQARNICMEVLYTCTGEYPKHLGGEAFRVLFVGGSDSCCSQMAEAIAQSLNRPEFIFNSAGLEPRPIEPRTVEFMREKGRDVSGMMPKVLQQVPNLDHYQVIVALDAGVKRAFPQQPRKAVYLDWSLQDPSQAQGSEEQVRAAYEAAFVFLESHIHDLIKAILGNGIDKPN
jgi:phosphate transport system protein